MGYVRRAWLLVLPLLSGCAGLTGPSGPGDVVVAGPQPPIVSDRFLLEDESRRVVGELQVIAANYEDTFVDIARTYNLGFDELVAANPDVDPWLPGAGTPVVLPTRFVLPDAVREGIVINIASKRLYFYPPPDADGTRAVMTHPIGIGRQGSETPLGETTVTAKGRDPVWWPPASIRREYAAEGTPLPAQVPPGPDNPLGKFVLVLGMPSYLIHGTNKPAGVGMRVSHGCVRLFPENIAELFDLVPVGTSVTIVNQPYAFAWDDGELLFEAHAPLADDDRDWEVELQSLLEAALAMSDVPVTAAGERIDAIAAAAAGMPLPVTDDSPAPAAVLAGATAVHNLVDHRAADLAAPAAARR